MSGKRLRIVLAGNPNCGKTTLFNRLTGSSQQVGNWPGLTVERKTGLWRGPGGAQAELADLPGVYSLSPYSPEERLARAALEKDKPDLILNLVDAVCLERSLYLTSQLMELGIPMVVALNRMDAAGKRGIRVDPGALGRRLGLPVAALSASRGEGLAQLAALCFQGGGVPRADRLPPLPRRGKDLECARAGARYDWAAAHRRACCRLLPRGPSATDRLDAVLLHRYLGYPILFCVLGLVFFLPFGPLGGALENLALPERASALLLGLLGRWGVSPWLCRFLTEGVLAGVLAAVQFLPRLLLLFLLLALLEGCGYLSRAAFLLDLPMRRLGLSGKGFVPLLLGFGCTVPAAMGTRILEQPGERARALRLLPFCSCSAKLPVYLFAASSLFPGREGLAVLSLYLGGLLAGLAWARLSRRKGEPSSALVMELPAYSVPRPGTVLRYVGRRGKEFLTRAASVLLWASSLVWLLGQVTPSLGPAADSSQSILAWLGRLAAPLLAPCGFGDWRAAVALLAGLLAKENVAGVLAVLYPAGLSSSFSAASGAAFLVFVLLYPPCAAALAALRAELGGRGALRAALFQLAAAWCVSAAVYQILRLFPGL